MKDTRSEAFFTTVQLDGAGQRKAADVVRALMKQTDDLTSENHRLTAANTELSVTLVERGAQLLGLQKALARFFRAEAACNAALDRKFNALLSEGSACVVDEEPEYRAAERERAEAFEVLRALMPSSEAQS